MGRKVPDSRASQLCSDSSHFWIEEGELMKARMRDLK